MQGGFGVLLSQVKGEAGSDYRSEVWRTSHLQVTSISTSHMWRYLKPRLQVPQLDSSTQKASIALKCF